VRLLTCRAGRHLRRHRPRSRNTDSRRSRRGEARLLTCRTGRRLRRHGPKSRNTACCGRPGGEVRLLTCRAGRHLRRHRPRSRNTDSRRSRRGEARLLTCRTGRRLRRHGPKSRNTACCGRPGGKVRLLTCRSRSHCGTRCGGSPVGCVRVTPNYRVKLVGMCDRRLGLEANLRVFRQLRCLVWMHNATFFCFSHLSSPGGVPPVFISSSV
jgi:hypothetical protein